MARKKDDDVPSARSPETVPTGPSPTAVAAEAYRSGVVPLAGRRAPSAIPHEESLTGGDDDASVMGAEYVGDEAPSGHMPTPDQDNVDAIGRAMGVSEEDSGALRSSAEILDRRDRHRAQQEGPDPTTRDIPERPDRNR
jgi:hypothetical protein